MGMGCAGKGHGPPRAPEARPAAAPGWQRHGRAPLGPETQPKGAAWPPSGVLSVVPKVPQSPQGQGCAVGRGGDAPGEGAGMLGEGREKRSRDAAGGKRLRDRDATGGKRKKEQG